MPYTRGAYGGVKSDDAERSIEYRDRQKRAADSQVGRQAKGNIIDISDRLASSNDKTIQSIESESIRKPKQGSQDRLPSVLKLRFELVTPYYTRKGSLDMEPVKEMEFIDLAKAEKGIIREVLVHGETTLHAIHYMIQKLFGWQNSHLHHYSVSDKDFDMVTDKQNAEKYFNLCGTLFRFPGAEMDDQFWDDDYEEGISFKTWLRHKYICGFNDFAVENSYLRNRMNVEELKERLKNDFKSNPRMTLKKLEEIICFEDPFNKVLEGIPVRNIFKNSNLGTATMTDRAWRGFEEAMIQGTVLDYEDFMEKDPEKYEEVMSMMEDLINLRRNILQIDQAIRYGSEEEVRAFYNEDPQDVLITQKKLIKSYEQILFRYLSIGNPTLIPFAEELFYIYDYGDDWCVKITLVDSYTANENYDVNHFFTHLSDDGVFVDERKIRAQEVQYKNLAGELVEGELREQLQKAYIKGEPVCVMADGLNVMDDIGGLYGYQDFLRTINSKNPDDEDEKEDLKAWAKGMGWTGRKVKPDNIL